MFRFLVCVLSLSFLTACDPGRVSTASGPQPLGRVCDGAGADRCTFVNGPVKLLPDPVKLPARSALFYPMAETLDFVDAGASRWDAPQGTLTDGASIPPIFVTIVGNPTSRQFAQAAAVHDAYCGIGNEAGPNYHARPWPQVHRMFYDALRVGGTPERKAKVMFAAVWLGGPRWGLWDRGLQDVPDADKRGILKRAQTLIETQNPTLDDLIGFMSREEDAAIAAARGTVHGGGASDGYMSEGDMASGYDPSDNL